MVWIQVEQDIFLASYSVGAVLLSWGWSGYGVKLTTNLYLVHRLRMSGAIPLLPLYAFMGMETEELIFLHTLIKNTIWTLWLRKENNDQMDLKGTRNKNTECKWLRQCAQKQ